MTPLKAVFGEFHWSPPPWARSLNRRLGGGGLILILVVVVLIAATFAWFQTRPQLPAIVATPDAPGVAAIAGEQLQPQPLVIDFSVRPGDMLANGGRQCPLRDTSALSVNEH